MEHIANLFEGCSIGRFKMELVFKYKRSCTIHSDIFTDNDNDEYRIAVNLFINDNNEIEFEWQKIYYFGMYTTYNEITDEDMPGYTEKHLCNYCGHIMESR